MARSHGTYARACWFAVGAVKRALVLIFSANFISKALIAVATVLLIRTMSASEYADYTFGFSIAMMLALMLAYSYNSVYIVGYKKLGLNEETPHYLTFQVMVAAGLAMVFLPFAYRLHGMYPAI